MKNEINDALVGAEKLCELISHSITLGSNSLETHAYQIKNRVKTTTSIRDKILNKKETGNLEYNVNDITDIIGVRFLTLFQQDLLSLVERFMNFVEAFQAPPTDLFFGKELQHCIKEVIVYQSNTTEEIYESIYNFLDGFFTYRKFPKNFVRLERKDTRYSSVHIIVQGQVHLNSEIKVIPIEFQLRTVFEDVWSEVQHYLMYKNSTLQNADNANFRRETGDRQLNILKANIDNCSEQANLAYFTLKSENPGASIRQAKNSSKGNTYSVLESIEGILGPTSDSHIGRLRDQIFRSYKLLHGIRLSDDSLAVAVQFEKTLQAIEEFDTRWDDSAKERPDDYPHYRYDLDMERAQANYWIGQALNDRSVDESDKRLKQFERSDFYFERARHIYFKLTSFEILGGDPILNYRVGQIYRKTSQFDLSEVYYRSAYKGLTDDDWKYKGSIFEVLIPRHLAFIIWSEAEKILQKHVGIENLDSMSAESKANNPIVQKYIDALCEAFVISNGIEQFEVKKEVVDVRSIDEEKKFAFNNGLWYGVEFLENGGNPERLCDENGSLLFNHEYYMKYEKYNNAEEITNLEVDALDTLLRAAIYFDDDNNVQYWLNELESRNARGDIDVHNWQLARYQMTIEKAKKKLNVS